MNITFIIIKKLRIVEVQEYFKDFAGLKLHQDFEVLYIRVTILFLDYRLQYEYTIYYSAPLLNCFMIKYTLLIRTSKLRFLAGRS